MGDRDRVFRRRIDGKLSRVWYAWVPAPGGGVKRVSTNCTDKQAAIARAAELERLAVDPHHAAANEATTEGVLSAYLASRQRLGRAAGTLHHVRTKSGHLRRILPARVNDVTHSVVEAYCDERLHEGAARTTVKKELRVLKAALVHAARNDLFRADPNRVIPEFADDYEPRERYLQPWELVALVRELGEDARAACAAFIVATSARWGEAQRAERSDIMTRGGRTYARLRGTKTKKAAREVPIVGVAAPLLAWALERAAHEGKLFPSWGNVRRDLHAACARAGIDPVTPNDLRRTCATWLQQAGVGNELVAEVLGHEDTRMVERVYGRQSPDDVARLLEGRLETSNSRAGSLGRNVDAVPGVDPRKGEGARTRAGDALTCSPDGDPAKLAVSASRSNRALFALAPARAALIDLALRAGITVTP
jgi:integrase